MKFIRWMLDTGLNAFDTPASAQNQSRFAIINFNQFQPIRLEREKKPMYQGFLSGSGRSACTSCVWGRQGKARQGWQEKDLYKIVKVCVVFYYANFR